MNSSISQKYEVTQKVVLAQQAYIQDLEAKVQTAATRLALFGKVLSTPLGFALVVLDKFRVAVVDAKNRAIYEYEYKLQVLDSGKTFIEILAPEVRQEHHEMFAGSDVHITTEMLGFGPRHATLMKCVSQWLVPTSLSGDYLSLSKQPRELLGVHTELLYPGTVAQTLRSAFRQDVADTPEELTCSRQTTQHLDSDTAYNIAELICGYATETSSIHDNPTEWHAQDPENYHADMPVEVDRALLECKLVHGFVSQNWARAQFIKV
jgi:hypothetical protein